jgi:Spy/CpxP family protein refolding chaperone
MLRTAIAALALAALPALARAQPMPPAPDRGWDRREQKLDRRELADDRWDLARAQELLARWDDARARRDRRTLLAVEDAAFRTLDRELFEARAEVRDPWAGGRDVHAARSPRGWDRRDDRRDLARVSALRTDFGSLRGRLDRRALDRKHAMLAELVQLARAELREDRPERRGEWRGMSADGRW